MTGKRRKATIARKLRRREEKEAMGIIPPPEDPIEHELLYKEEVAFEDSVNVAIDGLTEKYAKGRMLCYQGLEKIFATKFIPELVDDSKMTITEAIETALRKGRGDEQAAAARLSTLLCVQIQDYESIETVCKNLKPSLTVIANDTSVSANARAECCWALGMNQFFSGENICDTIEVLQFLANIFAGSYLRQNGEIATVSAEIAAVHAAAIYSWTLLLTIMSPEDVCNFLRSSNTNTHFPSLTNLTELLHSPHLDVRIAAGEAFAVIFDIGRRYDEDFEDDWAYVLIDLLGQLAADSSKSRARKDRKLQRASFREILSFIDKDIVPEMYVKFGDETLYFEGWCSRVDYNACCRLLGPGINIHLAENFRIRDVFNLPNTFEGAVKKVRKFRKRLVEAKQRIAAFKKRSVHRNKDRYYKQEERIYFAE